MLYRTINNINLEVTVYQNLVSDLGFHLTSKRETFGYLLKTYFSTFHNPKIEHT